MAAGSILELWPRALKGYLTGINTEHAQQGCGPKQGVTKWLVAYYTLCFALDTKFQTVFGSLGCNFTDFATLKHFVFYLFISFKASFFIIIFTYSINIYIFCKLATFACDVDKCIINDHGL